MQTTELITLKTHIIHTTLMISGATLMIVETTATVASAFNLGTVSNVPDRSQQLTQVLQKVGISSSDLNRGQQYVSQAQQ